MRSWPGSPGRTTWCHSWSRIPAACRRRPRCWIGSRARTRTPPCSSSSSPFRSTGTTTTDPASTMGSRRPWWRGRDFRWCLSQTKRILKEGSPSPKHCKSFFDRFAFPLESFDPRLFHGRQYPVSFLPEDRRQEYFLVAPAPPPVSAAASPEPPAEPPAEGEEAPPPAPAATGARDPPVLYRLDFLVTTQGRLPNGASDHEVREVMIKSYEHLTPLHRTTIVLVASG
mmetsp:Transcript_22516/g.50727  ORF Transcript_22516/g.50727 Transcript_22516/m.50727 type:complete len:227 (+) Transcript_22516:610-1290(+)